MSRLRLGERDWLSRHESHLLSCFAPHPQRKQILTAEHSTELRVVTVSVADVHQACTEDFTQLSLRWAETHAHTPCGTRRGEQHRASRSPLTAHR